MNLHLVGLPHTKTSPDYNSCAYTAKLYKFLKMFPDAIHYGNEGSAPCKNFVQIFSFRDQLEYFEREYWYQNRQWYKVDFSPSKPYWSDFNSRVISEIYKRLDPQDIILIIAGNAQKAIAERFSPNIVCEFGIGYEGMFSKYCVFESCAWQNFLYGKFGVKDGRFYDAVIPNFFDIKDFPLVEEKSDYLLFMGRPITRKGIAIVKELATRYNVVTAGAEPIEGLNYAGYADPEARAKLMGNAAAVLVPTLYIPPFEGVNVEAQLCGTPVITTDFGAFTETVAHGVSGFRCRSLKEFIDAVEKVKYLNPKVIRKRAASLYSFKAVKPQYERYFNHLQSLFGKGWYETN